MALSTMYPAMPGSPTTSLTTGIAADSTSMTVDDASVLPPAPNICVLGSDSSAEIVSYTNITGNVVSGMVRALGGTTASAWPSNTAIARNITSYDHDTFITNIEDLNTNKANNTVILYYPAQGVSAVSNAEMFRITNALITTDTVLLGCTFSNENAIPGAVSMTSYSGYVAFTGTCTDGTCTADVTLGQKGN